MRSGLLSEVCPADTVLARECSQVWGRGGRAFTKEAYPPSPTRRSALFDGITLCFRLGGRWAQRRAPTLPHAAQRSEVSEQV